MRSDSLIALLIAVGSKGYRPLFRQSQSVGRGSGWVSFLAGRVNRSGSDVLELL